MFRLNALFMHLNLNKGARYSQIVAGTASAKAVIANLYNTVTWWRHQMETISALLVLCAGNSPVTGEFPSQSPVTRSFDVFFHLRLNERLSKQSRGWWFETPSRPLWRHCNATDFTHIYQRYVTGTISRLTQCQGSNPEELWWNMTHTSTGNSWHNLDKTKHNKTVFISYIVIY